MQYLILPSAINVTLYEAKCNINKINETHSKNKILNELCLFYMYICICDICNKICTEFRFSQQTIVQILGNGEGVLTLTFLKYANIY